MAALLVALVLVVFVGLLQTALDAHYRLPVLRDRADLSLHGEFDARGQCIGVLDEDGRWLRGVVSLAYRSEVDRADRIELVVLARDRHGFIFPGRRTPKP